MRRSRWVTLTLAAAALGTLACSPRDRDEFTSAARSTQSEARQATQAAAKVIDDSAITAKVKSALLTDQSVKGMNIRVETEAGTVTLSGSVSTQAERTQAEAVAASVEGVKNVVNRISVS
jgi:hyperosmotically inducible protein